MRKGCLKELEDDFCESCSDPESPATPPVAETPTGKMTSPRAALAAVARMAETAALPAARRSTAPIVRSLGTGGPPKRVIRGSDPAPPCSRRRWRLAAAVAAAARGAAGLRGPSGLSFAPYKCSARALSTRQDCAVPVGETVVLDVGDMSCGACAASVRKVITSQPGVVGATVNLITGTAVVDLAEDSPLRGDGVRQLCEAVSDAGFETGVRKSRLVEALRRQAEGSEQKNHVESKRIRDLKVAWALAGATLLTHGGHVVSQLGLAGGDGPLAFAVRLAHSPALAAALGAAATFGPGRRLMIDGIAALSRGSPNMNSMVSVGVSASLAAGALGIAVPSLGIDASFLQEPVMLLAAILLGRALEEGAKKQAKTDYDTLIRMMTAPARLVVSDDDDATKGREVVVDGSIVKPGDVIRVLPGEIVPCDGEVLRGVADVDESLLTGESVPVTARQGRKVYSGSVVCDGELYVRATSSEDDSTVAHLASAVSQAQARAPRTQNLADRVAGKFCAGVMGVAGMTLAGWTAAGASGAIDGLDAVAVSGSGALGGALVGLKLAISVLAVACPCALGLATPTAVLTAVSAAARRGLLLRSGDVLERLEAVDAVVLDKTGTITQGRPAVRRVRPLNVFEDELVELAASVERSSSHPLAQAIVTFAGLRGIGVRPVEDAKTYPGDGASGSLDGEVVFVGRLGWVSERIGMREAPPEAPSSGTVVWVGSAQRGLLGSIELEDAVRSDAVSTVKALERLQASVWMVTGDGPSAAREVAARVGISPAATFASVRPEGKEAKVAELARQGRTVMAVGDGINDAPALAAADVGVAVAGASDVARVAADVVVMGDRLSAVPEAIAVGKATMRVIRQNLWWALGYNAVALPVAAGALLPFGGPHLTPGMAAAAMAASSLAVVGNSLRLRSVIADLHGRTSR